LIDITSSEKLLLLFSYLAYDCKTWV